MESTLLSLSPFRYPRHHLPTSSPSKRCCIFASAELQELRVCTNRSCRRQGSLQTLETLMALAPPTLSIKPCGCLGRCGAGPNMVAVPEGVIFGHCGTAARAAELMAGLCAGGADGGKKSLEALALRKRAECERENGNFSEAERLLSQAIDLRPFGGIHILHKERSLARFASGNYNEALEDTKQALAFSPNYHEAFICQGDVLFAMEQYDAAERAYSSALEIDPLIRRSKLFQTRIAKLREKFTAGKVP